MLYFVLAVSVPLGIRSTQFNPRLTMRISNNRADTVHFFWVDYGGNAVLYATLAPSVTITQRTFGTHPWLITTISGDLISVIIPYANNMDITIQ